MSIQPSHGSGNAVQTQTVRRSADDALDDRTFQRLLEATYELDEYYDLEARFVLLVAGRLGLRVGEIIHMDVTWIDRRRQMIEIPAHHDCRKGRDDGICGYCRQLASQRASHNDDMTMDDALAERWEPKTDAAVRSVPFDFHPKTEIVIEQYFDKFSEFKTSKSGVNRRLKKVVSRVDECDWGNIYPHCLRATAASWHASRGVDALTLQSLMGWSDLSTAHRYVRLSGERTQKALHSIHSR
jgi:integrase